MAHCAFEILGDQGGVPCPISARRIDESVTVIGRKIGILVRIDANLRRTDAATNT